MKMAAHLGNEVNGLEDGENLNRMAEFGKVKTEFGFRLSCSGFYGLWNFL